MLKVDGTLARVHCHGFADITLTRNEGIWTNAAETKRAEWRPRPPPVDALLQALETAVTLGQVASVARHRRSCGSGNYVVATRLHFFELYGWMMNLQGHTHMAAHGTQRASCQDGPRFKKLQ